MAQSLGDKILYLAPFWCPHDLLIVIELCSSNAKEIEDLVVFSFFFSPLQLEFLPSFLQDFLFLFTTVSFFIKKMCTEDGNLRLLWNTILKLITRISPNKNSAFEAKEIHKLIFMCVFYLRTYRIMKIYAEYYHLHTSSHTNV